MTDMRKLMNIASNNQNMLNESHDGEQFGFKPEQAMSISQVDERFGNMRPYKETFKNGAGVYMADVGSRGMLEDVTYIGSGPGFDFETYGSDQWDEEPYGDEDEEDEMYGDEGDTDRHDEFTQATWDRNVFVVGRNEEESDEYFYWNGK